MDAMQNSLGKISLIDRVHPQDSRSTVQIYEPAILAKLYPKLLQDVASFLDPASAATFSLTCRYVLLTLGTSHIESTRWDATKPLTVKDVAIARNEWYSSLPLLTPNRFAQRFRFLSLLARDQTDEIACVLCFQLHTVAPGAASRCSQLDGGRVKKHEKHVFAYLNISTTEGHDFKLPIFQMAMKRYQQGRYREHGQLLASLAQNIENSDPFRWHKVDEQFRVVAGSLCLRQQTDFLVPPSQRSRLAEPKKGQYNLNSIFCRTPPEGFLFEIISVTVCSHSRRVTPTTNEGPSIESLPMASSPTYRDLVNIDLINRREEMDEVCTTFRRAWLKWKEGSPSEETARCDFCGSELQIEFQDKEDGSVGITAVILKDLGDGSLRDDKWTRHLEIANGVSWKETEKTELSLQTMWEHPSDEAIV